jgi:hypothetical protein
MPADDPISALQALNESDERQRFPGHRFARFFTDIIKLFSPPGTEFTVDGIFAALDWLDRQSTENLWELIRILAGELKYRGAQIEKLMQASEAHRKFVAEDLPGLVLDGMRRSEGVRARGRIKRLARILVRAAEVGRRDLADHAEEMLRIATVLDERDVLVLREIVRVQGTTIQNDIGRVKDYDAHRAVRDIMGSLIQAGFLQGEVDGISAKLESFGLVSRAERNVNVLTDDPIPYALLQKGLDFVDYIKSAEEFGATNATGAH